MKLQPIRRLKRGLGEISPLFRNEDQETESIKEKLCRTTDILSVMTPGLANDSLFLSTFLASKITSFENPCSIVSISSDKNAFRPNRGIMKDFRNNPRLIQGESYGAHLTRITVSPDQFEAICSQREGFIRKDLLHSHVLFLDFEQDALIRIPRLFNLVDKWIFLLQPSFESLTEVYKRMKLTLSCNREAEFYVLFEGAENDQRGSVLFEKLAEVAAKHLGIHLFWLGCAHWAEGEKSFAADIAWEHLFISSIGKMDSPEKIALNQFIQSQFMPQTEICI